MGDNRGKDDGPPRLEDLAGRLLGSVLDLGWALWETARDVADFSVRAVRAAADVLLDSGMPSPGKGEGRVGRERREVSGQVDRDVARSPGAPAPRGQPDTEAAPPPPIAPGEKGERDPFSPPLPADYERDRLVAVERDPGTLFAWWDVTLETRDRARAELDHAGPLATHEPRTVLLVAIDGEAPREVELPAFATSGYVERPGEDVTVEITLGLSRGGRFAPLAGPFVVAARPISGDGSPASWRRVGDASNGATAAGGATTQAEAHAPPPSPAESDRLAVLSGGLPETGSPAWPGGRRRGPVTGHGRSSDLPSSR